MILFPPQKRKEFNLVHNNEDEEEKGYLQFLEFLASKRITKKR
jgi:hypothetical protein